MPDTIARLLIIDDQPASVGLLLAYLEDSDIDLLVALNGEDGLRIASEGQPDLILLDVQMPLMDGFSVCRRLKADRHTRHIPVIFLSAAIGIEDKLQGFAAGGADYITKPFSAQEVLARVFLSTRGPPATGDPGHPASGGGRHRPGRWLRREPRPPAVPGGRGPADPSVDRPARAR